MHPSHASGDWLSIYPLVLLAFFCARVSSLPGLISRLSFAAREEFRFNWLKLKSTSYFIFSWTAFLIGVGAVMWMVLQH